MKPCRIQLNTFSKQKLAMVSLLKKTAAPDYLNNLKVSDQS